MGSENAAMGKNSFKKMTRNGKILEKLRLLQAHIDRTEQGLEHEREAARLLRDNLLKKYGLSLKDISVGINNNINNNDNKYQSYNRYEYSSGGSPLSGLVGLLEYIGSLTSFDFIDFYYYGDYYSGSSRIPFWIEGIVIDLFRRNRFVLGFRNGRAVVEVSDYGYDSDGCDYIREHIDGKIVLMKKLNDLGIDIGNGYIFYDYVKVLNGRCFYYPSRGIEGLMAKNRMIVRIDIGGIDYLLKNCI